MTSILPPHSNRSSRAGAASGPRLGRTLVLPAYAARLVEADAPIRAVRAEPVVPALRVAHDVVDAAVHDAERARLAVADGREDGNGVRERVL